jgi:hypothetical protein
MYQARNGAAQCNFKATGYKTRESAFDSKNWKVSSFLYSVQKYSRTHPDSYPMDAVGEGLLLFGKEEMTFSHVPFEICG